MLTVDFTAQDAKATRPLKRAAVKTARCAARLEEKKARLRVSLMITDDETVRRLNAQYRGIDKPTDVLSFPSDEDSFLGDIAISLPRTRTQAEEYGHSIVRETAFLTAHAMLHLFGYDHENEDDEKKMREKQRQIMKKAGFEL